ASDDSSRQSVTVDVNSASFEAAPDVAAASSLSIASAAAANHAAVSSGRRRGEGDPSVMVLAAAAGLMNCAVSLPSSPAKTGSASWCCISAQPRVVGKYA